MSSLASLLRNVIWHALASRHAHLALRSGDAVRYPAAVGPFAAVLAPTPRALDDLASLLTPADPVWLIEHSSAPIPSHPRISILERMAGLQMLLSESAPFPPASDLPIEELGPSDLPSMLGLIDRNLPGYFRPETPRMGHYFGIRSGADLVSMAGQRFAPPGLTEISGLCTDRAHRGRGHAARLILHLARLHQATGLRSWLGVAASNTGAIALYQHLGFHVANEINFVQLTRRP